jgi:hypothetical protein
MPAIVTLLKKLRSLATNDTINKITSTYKKNINSLDQTEDKEIIFDIKSYLMIRTDFVLKFTQQHSKSKYEKFNTIRDIKTYKDVEQLMNDYIAVIEYFKRKREEREKE